MRLLRGSRKPHPAVDPERAALEAQIREARLRNARRIAAWTEVAPTDLVRRGRWFVNVPTDEVVTLYRGVAFASGTATALAEQAPLVYYVDSAGELVLFERIGKSWSAMYAKQVERESVARP